MKRILLLLWCAALMIVARDTWAIGGNDTPVLLQGVTVQALGSANSVARQGSSTGNPVTLTATGSDTPNIDISLVPKGSGVVKTSGINLSGLTASTVLCGDVSKNVSS